MKKLSFLASLMVLCLPLAASAQETAPKVEIFGGYSYLRDNGGSADFESLSAHGFNTALAGNITKHIGIVSEFSRFTKSFSFTDPIVGDITADASVITYLFGPRATLHRGKAEPFVHALFGGTRLHAEASALGVSESITENTFTYALGGGLDVKVHDNFAIRVAQLDYLGSKFEGERTHNFRFSVGVVIRLGKR
jgi:opacity protein-like surface antigen